MANADQSSTSSGVSSFGVLSAGDWKFASFGESADCAEPAVSCADSFGESADSGDGS